MGGRGAYSYSGGGGGAKNNTPLDAYAVASLNRGTAKGTTPDAAISRFREQLMDKKVEYSAYIDDAGYVHALGSTGKEGSTKIAPLSSVAKERGVSTIVHNHPHGGVRWAKMGRSFLQCRPRLYRLGIQDDRRKDKPHRRHFERGDILGQGHKNSQPATSDQSGKPCRRFAQGKEVPKRTRDVEGGKRRLHLGVW